ncbi:hypothetical protein [Microbacterium caowuchunii]|uniref:Uncharacterized protein n=1 Tax=Microbacterium caowuchunii TaxID=2614638 RepID=A0A5N0TLT9_9MICO|nr:hypothetical protein [Microbacterium caowuchunii]KAA9134926.1 hypothetical protein F6B40_04345 [Microbacterium caowuchunii]
MESHFEHRAGRPAPSAISSDDAQEALKTLANDNTEIRRRSHAADWWYIPANALTLALLAIVPGFPEPGQMFAVAALGCVTFTFLALLRRKRTGVEAKAEWTSHAVLAAVFLATVSLAHFGATMLLVRFEFGPWMPAVFVSAFLTTGLSLQVFERSATPWRVRVP